MIRACIVGWPVAHSRSPLIHNHWIAEHGLSGDYLREPVEPADLERFMRGLGERGYAGCNVTLPHKERAIALADDVTPVARAIGAANAFWLEGGRLRATNTDADGFLGNLDDGAPGWDRACDAAIVLGAGGAAASILHALLSRGVGRIHLLNRTTDKAEALAARFGPAVRPGSLAEAPALLPRARLVVNATSLGMKGQPPLDLPLAGLGEGCVVTDAVYVPLKTAFLEAAEARGARIVGGLGMLLHQAAPAFALWFGLRPTVTPDLVALVEADVRAAA